MVLSQTHPPFRRWPLTRRCLPPAGRPRSSANSPPAASCLRPPADRPRAARKLKTDRDRNPRAHLEKSAARDSNLAELQARIVHCQLDSIHEPEGGAAPPIPGEMIYWQTLLTGCMRTQGRRLRTLPPRWQLGAGCASVERSNHQVFVFLVVSLRNVLSVGSPALPHSPCTPIRCSWRCSVYMYIYTFMYTYICIYIYI